MQLPAVITTLLIILKKLSYIKKNAIKRYGSLEESRKAYGTGESPAKNYKDGYYGK